MPHPLQLAEAVREACISSAMEAYEDAGISGLCREGRWELALQEMRSLNLRPLVEGLQGQEDICPE
jgi:hypothetical protein